MSASEELKGPYIVWENYGYEGWKPTSYATLSEAVTARSYVTEWIVTKPVTFLVSEENLSAP